VAGQPRLILHVTSPHAPPLQPAIASAFADHRAWAATHGTQCVGALNKLLPFGRTQLDFMLAAEFRQEQKLADIAALVAARPSSQRVRVIAIAGPTSSGKTTFSHKLCAYLKNHGIESLPLSVDHYYYELNEQPVFKRTGNREAINYDSFEAMDVPLFNQHLSQLIAGQTVDTPRYNFKTGNRDHPGHTLTLPPNAILVMEGIHALNPAYTASVPVEMKFTIYISPLTQLTIDECNAVKTTNWRLLRRMTRDFLFRGHSAEKTMSMWERVREGEARPVSCLPFWFCFGCNRALRASGFSRTRTKQTTS
jgi:uridine kinase